MPQIRGKQLENAAISGNKIAANAVLGGHLANNSIAQSHLTTSIISGNFVQSQSILNGHLAGAVISGNKIAAGSVLNGHLAFNSISGNAIGNGYILNGHLAGAVISGNKIAANSILTGHIANNAIGQAQVVNGYADLTADQTISGTKLFHKLQVIGNPTVATDVVNKGYIDGLGLGSTPVPTQQNKNMPALVTNADGDKATTNPIAAAPIANGYVSVLVNGIQVSIADDNSRECFFGQGDTATPRALDNVTSGDTVRWNGSIAGYQLDGIDRIDLNYNV